MLYSQSSSSMTVSLHSAKRSVYTGRVNSLARLLCSWLSNTPLSCTTSSSWSYGHQTCQTRYLTCSSTALSLMISCRRASYLLQLSQGCSNSSSCSCNLLIKWSYAIQFASYFLLAGERIGVYSVNCIERYRWSAFSAMRAYALMRHWLITTVVLTLSLAPFAVNFVRLSGSTFMAFAHDSDGCFLRRHGIRWA